MKAVSSQPSQLNRQASSPLAPSRSRQEAAGAPAFTLTSEDLSTLKAPFPREKLGVKAQAISRERKRALLVQYLQHTDVQERLDQVDPSWSLEIAQQERTGDAVYVRARLTLKGVTRENVGEGGDPKAAHSDALKRCAMLFGVGRYLYDSPTVWVEYDESRDRYRQWSLADYERELGRSPQAPREAAQPAAGPAETPREKRRSRARDDVNRALMYLYRPYLTRFPETQFVDLLKSRYGVGETRMMTVEQLEDLIGFMQKRLEESQVA